MVDSEGAVKGEEAVQIAPRGYAALILRDLNAPVT